MPGKALSETGRSEYGDDMHKNHENCPIKGCGKKTNGKPYCPQHATVTQRRVMPGNMQLQIRSSCCDAKCIKGAAHDSGEQYCTKCKEPCHWKAA